MAMKPALSYGSAGFFLEKNMNKSLLKPAVLTSILMSFNQVAYGQSLLDQIESAISTGSVGFSLRARSEMVEQDNALGDASASTLKTRLTLKSGVVNGFSGLLEFDSVSSIAGDHYDSLITGRYRGNYSVIADPVGAEINQAFISYSPDESQTYKVGTQRINHAAQRFIGSVAWRQNEQTLDAISYSKAGAKFNLDYSYVWNVNRIFGTSKSSVQETNLDSKSHIAYSSYKTDRGTFSSLFYALDFDNAAALSSLTYGVSYANSFSGFAVNASFAQQSDYGSNTLSYDANYISADVSYNFGQAKVLLGYELLGSDDGVAAFQTPLATLHKWQGWTDLFLGTPVTGIEDSFLTVSGKLGLASLSATYHTFTANEGAGDYGSEWDIVATYSLGPIVTAQLKYATYDSDGFKIDTDKFWFSLSMAF
jgi:hypothetical protein